jgi:hypothetical protein
LIKRQCAGDTQSHKTLQDWKNLSGLCPACYVRANEVIKKGLTTWQKLEATKRVLPPPRQKTATVKWLLGRAI